MLAGHLRRGAAAGIAGGCYYGAFLALVGEPLVALAEGYEAGGAAHGGGVLSASASIGAGLAWGVLLGVVAFGAAYYLVGPAIPGRGAVRSYLLGAAGFVTVSGAPWLLLPPVPPGVESGLPTRVRLAWYAGMVVAGAVACGLAGAAYGRLRDRGRLLAVAVAATPLAGLAVPAVLVPATTAAGPAPPDLVSAFRWTTVFGQATLWFVMASAHAVLADRTAAGP